MDSKNTDFEDLLVQYRNFIENIYDAHYYLDNLIVLLNKFLRDYYKLKNFDEDFMSELELKLTYFENYYQTLDCIVDELDKFSLSDNRKNDEKKLGWSNVCLFYPKNYVEKDIYVPEDLRIDWDDIMKRLE